MAELTLTKTQMRGGVWEGVLTASGGAKEQPELSVTHLDKPIEGVTVAEDSAHGIWTVRVPVPVEVLGDGVQTFVISDAHSGRRLASFTLLAGDVLDGDIRAELDLLRAELDMLKSAFRRHCVETMG